MYWYKPEIDRFGWVFRLAIKNVDRCGWDYWLIENVDRYGWDYWLLIENNGRYGPKSDLISRLTIDDAEPEVRLLILLDTSLAEKALPLYTFYWKKVPLSHTYSRKSLRWLWTPFAEVF